MGYKNLFYIVSSAYHQVGNHLGNPASPCFHNPCSRNHHDHNHYSWEVLPGCNFNSKWLLLGVPFCDRVLLVNIGRPRGQ